VVGQSVSALGISGGAGGISFDLLDNTIELELGGNSVSGWDNVVQVNVLGEWLNFNILLDLLLAHILGNLSWISLDTDNQTMWIFSILGSGLGGADNDSLFACESTF
jgi:hypothetical protein